jgi:carboxymethylenebutenolidase
MAQYFSVGGIDRRSFVARLPLVFGAAAAFALGGGARGVVADVVPEGDGRLLNSTEEFRTRRGRARGYLSRPAGAGPARSAILVIHDSEGLTPHFRDIARRLAVEGYVALAPDFLSIAGGTLPDAGRSRALIAGLDMRDALAVGLGAIDFLVARRDTLRRAGIVGFGWGGGIAQELAIEARDVMAAVSFYGQPLTPQRAARLNVPLLMHQAVEDEETVASLSELAEALDSRRVDHDIHVYEGVGRGFHDDTADEAFEPEAAELAWSRTMSFLGRVLP